jgi:hypothetical protein
MDIIDMARVSGMTVILEGRIGREEYQSVCGSISALQRFAEAVRHCAANQNDSVSQRSSAANSSGRLRRCFMTIDTKQLARTKQERLARQNAFDKVARGTSAANAN